MSEWLDIEERQQVLDSWRADLEEFEACYTRLIQLHGVSRDMAYLIWTLNTHWNMESGDPS